MRDPALFGWSRNATVTRRADTGPVSDELARRLVESLPFDFSRFRPKSSDVAFTLLRTREFDEITSGFVEKHQDARVVEIGCGPNRRKGRIPARRARWYDLDLPEVIEHREWLVPREDVPALADAADARLRAARAAPSACRTSR